MMNNRYVAYQDTHNLMASHIKKTGEPCSFHEALQETISKKMYTTQKNVLKKRMNLSEEEFLNCIAHTQIDINYYNCTNHMYTDSRLIPSDLDVFAIKHLTYKEQVIHPHDCFDIHYVYSGKACLIFEEEVKLLSKGEICIMAPHSKYRIYTEDDESVVMTIYIRNSSFEQLFFDAFTKYDLISIFIRNVLHDSKGLSNYLLFQSENTNDMREIIQNIYIETNYKDSYSNQAVIEHTHLLFITILRNFKLVHSYKIFQNKKNDLFFEIVEYVQKNYQTVSMKELATKFHYNESYLSTLFIKYLGMNFTTIISQFKIDHAKSLLSETILPINEISDIVGYHNVDHFSRTFKKVNRCSPSEYRKKNRRC